MIFVIFVKNLVQQEYSEEVIFPNGTMIKDIIEDKFFETSDIRDILVQQRNNDVDIECRLFEMENLVKQMIFVIFVKV